MTNPSNPIPQPTPVRRGQTNDSPRPNPTKPTPQPRDVPKK